MKPNQVLPELLTATLSISLWFTPKQLVLLDVDISRLMKATGLAASTVLYAKSYLMLVCNWSRFEVEEQKEEIQESISLELYEYEAASTLAVKKMQIDKQVLEATVPLVNAMAEVEQKQHPELSEVEKQSAARHAIEQALAPTVVEAPQTVITEESIRKIFPEAMDSTSWKCILKALQSGASKDEIVRDVLTCTDSNKEMGKAYFEYLKGKFLG
jgi:hypothetical protein